MSHLQPATNMTISSLRPISILATLILLGPGGAQLTAQTTTRVMVRVTANDAKIIGSAVGGASVTIRDSATGEVLASGIQEGGTGSTRSIMGPRERGGVVYHTEGAAGFLAELELSEPTWVEIEATGPLGTPDALRRTSRTTLLVPGQDVLGEGIVLDLLGFTVELTGPVIGSSLPAGRVVEVGARVTMLCGCPTSPGGTWDSDAYSIVARELRDGRVVQEVRMEYAGTTSMYRGSLEPMSPGPVEIEVLAMDPAKGNFGVGRERFEVARQGPS